MLEGAFHVRMMFGHKGDIELPHDASHYSIMSAVLPALGTRSTHRAKFRPFIISPRDKRYCLEKDRHFNYFWHLKELKDPIIQGVLREIENTLARGRMDLPLSLHFAIIRGGDLLLHQLLQCGLDPNEFDINGHTDLHLAASKGNVNCVILLLDYGVDTNSLDSLGSVPLWEAVLSNHEPVIRLLIDNGADLSYSDMARYACTIAQQNSIELLKDIIKYGGDVTLPSSNGTIALHLAVCERNAEMVKFLLEQGADIDKESIHGMSPKDYAGQQGHEDIKSLFEVSKSGEDENQTGDQKKNDESND